MQLSKVKQRIHIALTIVILVIAFVFGVLYFREVQEKRDLKNTQVQSRNEIQELQKKCEELQKQIDQKNADLETMSKDVDEVSKAYQNLMDTIHSAPKEQTLESLQKAIEKADQKTEKEKP